MDAGIALDFLGTVDDKNRQKLAQFLWGWDICVQCTAKASCSEPDCPWRRAGGLDTFWKLYKCLTDTYIPEGQAMNRALNNHADVLHVMQSIKDGRTVSQKELLQKIFVDDRAQGNKPPTSPDQKSAFNISASLLLLMDFGVLHDAANISTGALPPIPWRDELSIDSFVKEAFQVGTVPSDVQRMVLGLKAKKLMSNAKLRLESTNDIRRHLVLDQKAGVVWMFHQTAALREHLSATENDTTSCILPRALMIEVLDTIHYVLFPMDLHSQGLLDSLVSKNGWDKGLLSNMSKPWRKDSDPKATYTYFGERLRELHEELQNPTPHGWLQRRLKRKSESYMLKATVIGVLIAVTLSFMSLVVALFQAWVAYQQWKHPVKGT